MISIKKKNKGFLLLEVIIASSLLSIVSILIMQMLFSSINLNNEIDNDSNHYHIVRQIMSRMVKELSMAHLIEQKNEIKLNINNQFLGLSNRIKFRAFGNIIKRKNEKLSDQREISYYLEKNNVTGKKSLLRKVQANPWLCIKNKVIKQVLCTNVSELKFHYWDSKECKWESRYILCDIEKYRRLPKCIKIELTIIVKGKKMQKFLTQSEIKILKPISFG